ncbi:alpha/beta hydrolase [Epilithonimonas sp. JDS]|uniref:alpha/beta hydrolase n=1 Tax=Epilithonimonas sp. JDS TaxID=2902797 RepID=UPI001E369966|nr:alpha/beta fold hydrolase [Epilithonimonas sp. JDS]MCD9854246.1 alpha/beta hydrolase [Epilithonimonas sp. JDS]
MKTSVFFSFFLILISLFSKAQMDDKFYQPKKEMKPLEFKNIENIILPVESDTITAVVLKPESKSIKKTIVFFHGAAGNISTYQYITKPLVEDGFQVVMVDVRGYGKSTGKPTHLNVAEDAQKMFDYLLTRKDIQNTKIYLYGASLGSQIATYLAKENSTKISGLIVDGGMSSFTDIAIHFAPQYKEIIEKALISPYSAKEDVKTLNNIPKLFIYSKGDSTVPFEQGQLIYTNAPEPKQFIEYSGEHLQAMVLDKNKIVTAIEKL